MTHHPERGMRHTLVGVTLGGNVLTVLYCMIEGNTYKHGSLQASYVKANSIIIYTHADCEIREPLYRFTMYV
jgi:hypothetical protein